MEYVKPYEDFINRMNKDLKEVSERYSVKQEGKCFSLCDSSLDETVFKGNSIQIEAYVSGLLLGRNTQG